MIPPIITIIVGGSMTFIGLIFIVVNITSRFNEDEVSFLETSFIRKQMLGIIIMAFGALLMIIAGIISAINALN